MINQKRTKDGRLFRIHLKRPDKTNTASRGHVDLNGVAQWIKKNGTGNIKKITRPGGAKFSHEQMLKVMEFLH